MAYLVVTGSTPAALASALFTASLDGWSVVGGLAISQSNYSQLMVRGTGVAGLTTAELTPTLNSSFTSSAKGPWQVPFPSGSFGIPGLSGQPV